MGTHMAEPPQDGLHPRAPSRSPLILHFQPFAFSLVSPWPQPWVVLSQLWKAGLHGAGEIRAFVWFLSPRALGLSHGDTPEQALNSDCAPQL